MELNLLRTTEERDSESRHRLMIQEPLNGNGSFGGAHFRRIGEGADSGEGFEAVEVEEEYDFEAIAWGEPVVHDLGLKGGAELRLQLIQEKVETVAEFYKAEIEKLVAEALAEIRNGNLSEEALRTLEEVREEFLGLLDARRESEAVPKISFEAGAELVGDLLKSAGSLKRELQFELDRYCIEMEPSVESVFKFSYAIFLEEAFGIKGEMLERVSLKNLAKLLLEHRGGSAIFEFLFEDYDFVEAIYHGQERDFELIFRKMGIEVRRELSDAEKGMFLKMLEVLLLEYEADVELGVTASRTDQIQESVALKIGATMAKQLADVLKSTAFKALNFLYGLVKGRFVAK